MTSYTIGNWTVSSNYADTLTTTKSIVVPDLSYASDYSLTADEPDDCVIKNVTSTNLNVCETLRFARQSVKNIYERTGTTATSAKIADPSGVQIMFELNETYSASNSVTGQEAEIPCVGRIVLRFGTSTMVTSRLIEDLLTRTIATSFATGKTNADRAIQLARGIVVPTGL